MKRQDRLKENRRAYRNQFFLGLLGGSGLLSILFLGIYNFFKGNSSQSNGKSSENRPKSPEQFESIYSPSDRS